MMHNILRRWHRMVGVDFHIPYVPPTGNPLWPPQPYLVADTLTNFLKLEATVLYAPKVYSDSTQAPICRGSDIGMLIPHIGTPSITMFIEMLLGGSKCYFGPMSVSVSDQHGGSANPAAAILKYVNINLNCGFPCPTPFGFVLAANTTVTHLTAGDITAGFYAMGVDFVFQSLINVVSGLGWHFLGKLTGKLANRFAARLVRGMKTRGRAAAKAANKAQKAANKRNPAMRGRNPAKHDRIPYRRYMPSPEKIAKVASRVGSAETALSNITSNVVMFFMGSPLGTDAGAPMLPILGTALQGKTFCGVPLDGLFGKGFKALQDHGVPTDQEIHDRTDRRNERRDQPGADPASGQTPASPRPAPPPPSSTSPAQTPPPQPSAGPGPSPQPGTATETSAMDDYINDPSVEDIGNP